MRITAGMPCIAADSASACAWFPDDAVTTPRARSRSGSDATVLYAPRNLNAPARWRFSGFSRTCAPVRSSMVVEVTTGVRRAIPSRRAAARRTSSRSITARRNGSDGGGGGVRPLGRPDDIPDRGFVALPQQLHGVRVPVDDLLEERLPVLVGRQRALPPPAHLVEDDRQPGVLPAELLGHLA